MTNYTNCIFPFKDYSVFLFCSQSDGIRASHLGTFCPISASWCAIPPPGRRESAPRTNSRQQLPPLPRYLPAPCPSKFRSDRALLTRPVSLCQRVLLHCMAGEEERGQDSYGREAEENETKDKILVLTLSPSPPCSPHQLIVINDHWPHHDRGHGVAQGPGERENSGGAAATVTL